MPSGVIPPGHLVAAVSGAALVLLMLLDWFEGRNAWQLKYADLLLLAIALLAIAVAASGFIGAGRGAGRGVARGRPDAAAPAGEGSRTAVASLLLTVLGGVGVGVMLTLVLESTGGTVPLVLSLVAAAGILAGGLMGRAA